MKNESKLAASDETNTREFEEFNGESWSREELLKATPLNFSKQALSPTLQGIFDGENPFVIEGVDPQPAEKPVEIVQTCQTREKTSSRIELEAAARNADVDDSKLQTAINKLEARGIEEDSVEKIYENFTRLLKGDGVEDPILGAKTRAKLAVDLMQKIADPSLIQLGKGNLLSESQLEMQLATSAPHLYSAMITDLTLKGTHAQLPREEPGPDGSESRPMAARRTQPSTTGELLKTFELGKRGQQPKK